MDLDNYVSVNHFTSEQRQIQFLQNVDLVQNTGWWMSPERLCNTRRADFMILPDERSTAGFRNAGFLEPK
jgi:hypothetical protein